MRKLHTYDFSYPKMVRLFNKQWFYIYILDSLRILLIRCLCFNMFLLKLEDPFVDAIIKARFGIFVLTWFTGVVRLGTST